MDACLKTVEVEAFVAGDLSAEDQARFEAHLSSCPDCSDAVGACSRDRELTRGIQQAYPRDTVSAPPATVSSVGPGAVPGVAESIEGYEILHEIHRGGQGVVYKAVQRATKRTVALKVLLHGPYATARQQHRFEREIDLVASLQHPNIVTVYDSGLAQGRHYFAMEYIHGQSLDGYLSDKKLSIEATLRLFQKICSAVNAAHQRGVIHRDLKPGNIRVDAEGEPHILDFGLAKAAGSDLRDGVPVTMAGEFMGTLAYASPEQTRGDPGLVDIRTDVYSLGVILFEMLTGKYPYQVVGHMTEVLKNIAEAPPRKPSTIRRQIDNEVETIVLQALAKEKERRYQTADALGRDVGRYLAGEPLDAKRDSTWYLLRKSLRRYYLVASVAAAFVLILAASTVALSVMYRDQSRARREAETARAAEAEQRALAEERTREAMAAGELARLREAEAVAARAETQKRADELEIVTEFQQSMLSEIDAETMGRALYADLRTRVREALDAEEISPADRAATFASFDRALRQTNATDAALKLVDEQVLRRAAETIELDFADQPVVRAALQQTVADTYCDLGRYPPALPLQEAALRTRRAELGDDHPETLCSLNNMGGLLKRMGRFEEAFGCYQEALEGRRRVLGDDHPVTFTSINNLGLLVCEMGRIDDALGYYREALDGRRRVLGNDHPDTLVSINNMGALLKRMGKYEDALTYHREGLAGNRRVLGDDHRDTLVAMNNMGNLLKEMDRLDEALDFHREALVCRRRVLGDDHPDTMVSVINMGVLLMSMGKSEEALEHFREALDGWRRTLGDDHRNTLIAVGYMGVLLKQMGRLAEAEPYFREALEGNRRALGDDHPDTITAVHNMGRLLRDLGKIDEAEAHGAEAVSWARKSLPEGHPNVAAFLHSYGVTLARLERYADAEATLLEAYEIIESAFGANHRHTLKIVDALVDLYDAWHAAEPERGYDAKAAAWREKLAGSTGTPTSRRGGPGAHRHLGAHWQTGRAGWHRPNGTFTSCRRVTPAIG